MRTTCRVKPSGDSGRYCATEGGPHLWPACNCTARQETAPFLHRPLDELGCWMYKQVVKCPAGNDNRARVRPLSHASLDSHSWLSVLPGKGCSRKRPSAFLEPLLDDCAAGSYQPNGIKGLTGFGVMESPDRRGSQPRERIPRQGGCRSTLLCALRPWLREADAAGTLSTGLACCTLNPPPRSSLGIQGS